MKQRQIERLEKTGCEEFTRMMKNSHRNHVSNRFDKKLAELNFRRKFRSGERARRFCCRRLFDLDIQDAFYFMGA